MKTVGIILAAGRSKRFKGGDKLTADLHGQPLMSYAIEAMRETPLDHRILVVREDHQAALGRGFENLRSQATQSDSLRQALHVAERLGAKRVLFALADMPFVRAELLARILALCVENAACAFNGEVCMPPACFQKSDFPKLKMLQGDQGARALLKEIPRTHWVRCAPQELIDIDTRADLALAHENARS